MPLCYYHHHPLFLIYKAEREKKTCKFLLFVHFSNACTDQGWTKLKPRAENTIQVSAEWQRPKYLSNPVLLLLVQMSRKLELGAALIMEPRDLSQGH